MKSVRLTALTLAILATPAVPGAAPSASDSGSPEKFLTGRLLVAAPDMGDPRFEHAVILLIHHDQGGAIGIIVNRPSEEQSYADLLGDLGQNSDGVAGKVEVYAGGPVEPRIGFVVHSAEYHRSETMDVDSKVAVTSSPAVLRDIAGGHGPQKFIIAFGYAGWGPGQLESELKQQAWFTAPDDPTLLFDEDRATLWQSALDRRERSL